MKQNCTACILEKKNCRPANPPKHTCARGDKNYTEPEQQTFVEGIYHKIFIHDEKFYTGKAALYRLKAQYLNGYKVKSYTEIWFQVQHTLGPEKAGETLWIWLKDEQYKKLAFV
jgi:hypothetical protein